MCAKLLVISNKVTTACIRDVHSFAFTLAEINEIMTNRSGASCFYRQIRIVS